MIRKKRGKLTHHKNSIALRFRQKQKVGGANGDGEVSNLK